MVWDHATLDGIRGDLGRVAEENNWERFHTPRNLLLALQKEVGNLAEVFRWGDEPVQREEDRRQIEEGLGDVLAYTVRLADRCGVDLARTMNQKLNRASIPVVPIMPQQQQQQQPASAVPVPSASKPRETANTSPDRRGSPGRSGGYSAGVGGGGGGGAPQKQSPSNKQQQQQQQQPGAARPKALDADSLRKHDIASKRPAFKRTLSVVCKPNHVEEELYSPTHYQHDLFSPTTNKTDFDVEYNTSAPPLPKSVSRSSLHDEPMQRPASPLSPRSLDDFYTILGELEKQEFTEQEVLNLDLTFCAPLRREIVPLVEGGWSIKVTKELMTTFMRLCKEMQAQGADYCAVPLAEALAKDKEAERQAKNQASGPFAAASATAATNKSPTSNKVTPKEKKHALRRTLSVQLPAQQRWDNEEKDKGCFSPTHFDHGLFSPTTNKTDFELEYTEEGAKRTLPQSISKSSMSKERDIALHDAPPTPEARLTPVNSEVRRTSVASFCSGEDDEEEYRGLDLLVEVAEEQGQDRNSRLKEHLRSTLSPRTKELETDFLPMIADIESMLQGGDITENDLQEMELTFCIPAKGRVYDLITNGRTTPVTLDRLQEFISLAKEKRKEIASEG